MVLKLAIAAAIIYGFAWTQLFYAPTCVLWYSALIQGFIIGVLANDVTTGLVLGGNMTLLTISQVASGGIAPSDIAFAGAAAIPIAMINNMDLGTALTLSIVIGLLGEYLTPVLYTVANVFPHMADKCIENGDIAGLKRVPWLGAGAMFILSAPVAFLTVYLGAEAIGAVMEACPEWILNGLNVAGGVLPAIGIAVTMNIINQPKLTPVMILGYFLVVIFELSIIEVAIIGFCVVAILLANPFGGSTSTATVEDDD